MESRNELVLRVAAFCLFPKDRVAVDAIVCFTGDGYGLMRHTLKKWSEYTASESIPSPLLFITGADNLMCKGETAYHNESRFQNWLVEKNVPPLSVITDDNAHTTLGQAKSLVAHAQQYGWRMVLLIASGYHIIRAWLTVLKSLQKAHGDLLVIPEPSYELAALGHNPELRESNPTSAWALFNEYTLWRIPTYQHKGDVASWQIANDYLHTYGF